MNKVFLIGNLTKDTELMTTNNGITVCKFSIAVNRKFSKENEADFFNIVAWRGLAENCGKFLSKGKKVAVVGSVQIRSYEADDGTKRYITEIQADEVEFLSAKADEQVEPPKSRLIPSKSVKKQVSMQDLEKIEDDENLPF